MSARRPGMQGVCKGGVCVCQPGYRGSYCEIPPACSGILDQDGNCCATGIVSQNGTCCAQARMPFCVTQVQRLCQSDTWTLCNSGAMMMTDRPPPLW